MKYKVTKTELDDNIYRICQKLYVGDNWVSSYPPITPDSAPPVETWNVVFTGTLPECDAWLNLKEKNYI